MAYDKGFLMEKREDKRDRTPSFTERGRGNTYVLFSPLILRL
jgi:hypothetical protein